MAAQDDLAAISACIAKMDKMRAAWPEEVLLEIAKHCDIAAKTAIRLREANQ